MHLCNLVNELSGVEDGLSQQNLSALESRGSNKSEHAAYLALALEVSLWWLLTGKGDKTEGAWPFKRVSRSRWDECDAGDRGYIESAINRALEECESSREQGKPQRAASAAPTFAECRTVGKNAYTEVMMHPALRWKT